MNIRMSLSVLFVAAMLVGCGSSSRGIYRDASCGSTSVPGSLGPEVNSSADDYAPLVAPGGGALYYTSGVRLPNATAKEKGGAGRYAHLFVARPAGGDGWGSPALWPDPLRGCPFAEGGEGRSIEALNAGTATMSADGRTTIFAAERASIGGGLSELFDLYQVDRSAAAGIAPCSPTLDSANEPGAWDTQPALSPDGSTLFFVSDRPRVAGGARGDRDIFISARTAGGAWSRPERLGATVNTPGNEASPHVGADGYLYFASDGNPDSGAVRRNDLDIFRVSLTAIRSGASRPERLGGPINTEANEDFPCVTADRRTLYFASDRSGGCGGRDLYRFALPSPAIRITGTITALDEMGVPTNVSGLRVVATDVESGRTVEATTDGAGVYQLPALEDRTYRITLAPRPCFEPHPDTSVHTVRPYAMDTAYRVDAMLRGVPLRTITLGAADVPFFITGYWHPNTPENLERYKRLRDAEHRFAKVPYIQDDDYKYDDAAAVVERLFQASVYATIREKALPSFFGECLPANSDAVLMIVVKGYTDKRTLSWDSITHQPGPYVDVPVTVGGMTINTGDPMNDEQGGNLKLSKLRAYFTLAMIDTALGKMDDRYVRLKNAGRVVLGCEGYGHDPNLADKLALNRRIEVMIRVLKRAEAERIVNDLPPAGRTSR